MYKNSKNYFFIQDFAIIFLSILVAVVLVKAHILENVLNMTSGYQFLSSFIAGMFFTSIFTTTPAIVTLAEIMHGHSIILTAFFGAMGAVMGDLVIFRFVRDQLSDHLLELIEHRTIWKRIHALFRLKYFRWFTFLLGGFIISSPLPDELGIGLMGFSKMTLSWFIPISFIFNFIGIVAIGVAYNVL